MTEPEPQLERRSHQVEAGDGLELDVLEVSSPAAAKGGAVACVIAGHAMLVDRRTLWREDRPSLVGALAAAGCRALVPALRGHPPTGPVPSEGGDWSYDDLVADTPAYIELARSVAPEEPVFLLGHSLFGHTSLAFLGRWPEHRASRSVTGVVTLASGLWNPAWERSVTRRLTRRLVVEATWLVTRLRGFVPGRRTGFGTADESLEYWRDFVGVVREGAWRSRDGFDYWRGLSRVSCPVLWVASEGDPLSPPALSRRLAEPLPRCRLLVVGEDPRRAGVVLSPAPGHMQLATSPSSRPLWEAVASWIVERARRAAVRPTAAGSERGES